MRQIRKIDYLPIFFFLTSIYLFNLNRKKLFKKKNKKLIGLSFGPTGGLFAYNLGITKYLQEKFNLDNLIFAGTSGGVQSCIMLSFNIKIDEGFNKWLRPLVNDIKGNLLLNIFPPWNMMDISKNHLYKNISKYDLSKLNGKFYASITKIFPYPHNHIESKWINNYNDLYDALKASQYLPFLSGYPTCKFRNCYCVDGYLTNTRFEPVKGGWIHINPFRWRNKNIIHGITSLSKISDMSFHLKEYRLGYEDAKKNHKYFKEKGLIEK